MAGPDPELLGDQGDPYIAWARMAQPEAAPPPPMPPPSPELLPGSPDQYAAWAGQPVTSPTDSPPPAAPVTSPTQVPPDQGMSAPEGPVTVPSEAAPAAPGTLGGDVAPADRAKALETMTPEDRAAAVQSMTPDEFVAYKATRNRAALMQQAALEHQINAQSEQRAREDLVMQRTAIAKADADTRDVVARANVLANTKIDPDRFVTGLRDRGHFGLMVVLSGLGGLVSEQTGGRNMALDMFHKRVENDIAAQHADIANQWRGVEVKKGAIADELARSGDLYKAQETYRIAAYQSAIGDMQSQLQQFDPAGGTAATIRDNLDQFHAAQQQALMAFNQQQLKNHLDVAKEDREQRLASSTIAKNAAETSKLYSEAKNAKTQAQVFTPEMLNTLMPPGSPIPRIPMDQKTYGEWLENTKKGQEASLGGREYSIGGVAKAQRDADGNVLGMEYKPLLNKDGKEFYAPSKEEATKLRTQKAGVDVVNALVDQMVAGIKEHGGASAFFKSPEWQTMQANKESLLFALHAAYGVEGFRPGVLEQMEHALGGQDPSKITVLSHNAVPGLQAAKKAVNAHFDANLRAQQYTGEEYSPESAIDGEPLPKLSGRTGVESQPGPLDRQVAELREGTSALLHPLDDSPQPGTTPDLGPSVGPTGLSPDDTAKVQEMIRRYNKGTPATKEKVLAAIAAPLTAGRPSLNTGVLGLLRDDSPELYKQVLPLLSPEEQQQEAQFRAARAALPKVP